ncbi:hypothetical protein RJF_3073 [Candidozyma auris]|uniref:Uncharacterized protein n=1 Tax=Candidozyma auris TaxID=498019 RepID=A0A2H0ZKM3_CANAR|nr:hypothetical protein B9J08_002773 [[Candida] auris]
MLYAYKGLPLKRARINCIFITIVSSSAIYALACAIMPSGVLIPTPDFDFASAPISSVEDILRHAIRVSHSLGIVALAFILGLYYSIGSSTEKGLECLDDSLYHGRGQESGEKLYRAVHFNHTKHRSVRFQDFLGNCFTMTGILSCFVAFWPANWLLAFSHTIYEYHGCSIVTDHILWSMFAFALAKTCFTCIKNLSVPCRSFSNGVQVWTNFCWLYGTGLIVVAGVFWALASDVMMVYMYKATALIQQNQRLDSVIVAGIPKQFNFVTSAMAEFLLDNVFSHQSSESVALSEVLQQSISVFARAMDDSIWIIMLWIAVLSPLFKGVVVHYTIRNKMAS